MRVLRSRVFTLLALALLPACTGQAQPALSIYVIDVGQGDSTLILGPAQLHLFLKQLHDGCQFVLVRRAGEAELKRIRRPRACGRLWVAAARRFSNDAPTARDECRSCPRFKRRLIRLSRIVRLFWARAC